MTQLFTFLFLFCLGVEAKPAEKKLDPNVLFKNVYVYMAAHIQEGCLGELNKNLESQTEITRFLVVAENETMEFCELTFEHILPRLCDIERRCSQTSKPDLLPVDILFALYYANQQIVQRHQDYFSCKAAEGQEILGNIIKPEAYNKDYDARNGVLAKALPKCSMEDDKVKRESKFRVDLIENQPLLQIFNFKTKNELEL